VTVNQPRPDIELVGSFLIASGGVRIARPAQRLLALLALHERPLTRDFVAFTLWPETTEERAAASLRTAVWSLRGLPIELVVATTDTVALASTTSVDYHRLRAQARSLAAGLPTVDVSLLGSFGRDLLCDWYDDWVVDAREQWRVLRLDALDAIARRALADGCIPSALEACVAASAADPLRETTRHLLIEAHLAQGNRAHAVRVYRDLTRSLRDELGVPPSLALDALMTSAGLLGAAAGD
jgi:DNA-binding SARP family transcriptional activator